MLLSQQSPSALFIVRYLTASTAKGGNTGTVPIAIQSTRPLLRSVKVWEGWISELVQASSQGRAVTATTLTSAANVVAARAIRYRSMWSDLALHVTRLRGSEPPPLRSGSLGVTYPVPRSLIKFAARPILARHDQTTSNNALLNDGARCHPPFFLQLSIYLPAW